MERFESAMLALNERCGHGHTALYFNGYAQYVGPWCPEWADLVSDQREAHRDEEIVDLTE